MEEAVKTNIFRRARHVPENAVLFSFDEGQKSESTRQVNPFELPDDLIRRGPHLFIYNF